jgi:hypothetical protein
MLKYRVEYQPLNVQDYERHYREQQSRYLERKAARLGLQIIEPALALAVS